MNDEAVQEVVGFLLAFLLSTVVLIISMQAFVETKRSSDALQAASQLELVSSLVATQVAQATVIAQTTPNATYEKLLWLPELRDVDYYVEIAKDVVWANSTDRTITSNGTTFRSSVIPGLSISGRAAVQGAVLRICYWREDFADENPLNDLSYIRIQEGSKRCRV